MEATWDQIVDFSKSARKWKLSRQWRAGIRRKWYRAQNKSEKIELRIFSLRRWDLIVRTKCLGVYICGREMKLLKWCDPSSLFGRWGWRHLLLGGSNENPKVANQKGRPGKHAIPWYKLAPSLFPEAQSLGEESKKWEHGHENCTELDRPSFVCFFFFLCCSEQWILYLRCCSLEILSFFCKFLI